MSSSSSSSSSSSAAVLTEKFDFDLHLESDKPRGILSRGRPVHILGFAVVVGLVSSMQLFRPAAIPSQQILPIIPPANIIIPEPIILEDTLSYRLARTEELNEQITLRINALNDTVSTLRSRVFEIEKKPVIINVESLTAVKIAFHENVREMIGRIKTQATDLEKLNRAQMATSSGLEELKQIKASETVQLSSIITNIEDRIARLRSRVEVSTVMQSETSKSRMKIQNLLLLQKISKLEERFSTALEKTENAFSHMRSDLNFTVLNETDSWDAIGTNQYSGAFVEGIVRNVWDENKAIYQSLLPDLVCPIPIIPPPKIVEVIVVEKVEVQPIIAPPVVYTPDFARRLAGARIVSEGTSKTYTPSETNFKQVSSNILSFFGVGSESSLVTQLNNVVDTVAPSLIRVLGVDSGIGRPEDAISSAMDLGSCWPMEGQSGTITVKLAQPVYVESISVDHVSREDVIDVRSAPRDFKVLGSTSRHESNGGGYSYNTSGNYTSSQNFVTMKLPEPTQYVHMQILSNYGNPDYTCLYRLRVHGSPAMQADSE